jgi:DNA-binding PadR family transcriptional regulator
MNDFDERFERGNDRFDRAQHRMWRKFEAMGRRGGGWGGGFGGAGRGGWGNWGGDWGNFGDNFRIGRMLASGDLRLIALYFIEQQPRHGYDLIKAIEDKTGGIYVPSPGVIYPALTFLEEANYVTSVAEGNKRLYTITDEGRTYLNDNRAAVEGTLAHLGKVGEQFAKVRERWQEAQRGFDDHRPDRDMADVDPAVNDARRDLKDAIKAAARNREPENQRRLADILRRAAEEIRRGPGPQPDQPDDIDL